MRLFALSIIASSVVAAAAFAAEPTPTWTPVSWGGKAGDLQLFFVNRPEVVQDGEHFEVETLMIRQTTSGGVASARERSVIDCGARSSTMIEAQLFSSGDKVLHRLEGDSKAETFPVGSAWRILIDTVCDGSYPEIETTNPSAHAEHFFEG